MKYLVTGISLLQNDAYLQMKMGGVTLNNAGLLANTLKNKVSELDIKERIEPTAHILLEHEYGKPNLRELKPGRRKAINIDLHKDGDDFRSGLKVLAGNWQNTGIKIPTSASSNAAREPTKLGERLEKYGLA